MRDRLKTFSISARALPADHPHEMSFLPAASTEVKDVVEDAAIGENAENKKEY